MGSSSNNHREERVRARTKKKKKNNNSNLINKSLKMIKEDEEPHVEFVLKSNSNNNRKVLPFHFSFFSLVSLFPAGTFFSVFVPRDEINRR